MRILALAAALVCLACGGKESELDALDTRAITLPDGAVIRAEVMMRAEDMMRGMMFRDSLREGRGMLFIHGSPGNYPYWMYQVKVPLDIIWMDKSRSIVEISPDTPPCTTVASQCPKFGGNQRSLFVLELPAGSVKKHRLQLGQPLSF